MGLRKDETYDFSAQIRGVDGSPVLRLQLYGGNGALLDSVGLTNFSARWEKYTATLHPKDTDAKARLAKLSWKAKASLTSTWFRCFRGTPGKIVPAVCAPTWCRRWPTCTPAFLRFPGGCIVEGSVLTAVTSGKTPSARLKSASCSSTAGTTEFVHRPTPDYYQSFGLGFYEYFQLCEDIGAQPLPILNCGMACQFNSGELCPLDELGALHSGRAGSDRIRQRPGHQHLGRETRGAWASRAVSTENDGVGNEQWGQQYIDRYTLFAKALKEKHPEIKLVSAAGPSPDDDRFNFLWPNCASCTPTSWTSIATTSPTGFSTTRIATTITTATARKFSWANTPRKAMKTVSVKNRNNLECALAEAAYMTGLERNGDVVRMASYAPLFANTEAWQWTPDLIWVDSLHVYRTPNYYVQQLYSLNHGDAVLPVKLDAPPAQNFTPPPRATTPAGNHPQSRQWRHHARRPCN